MQIFIIHMPLLEARVIYLLTYGVPLPLDVWYKPHYGVLVYLSRVQSRYPAEWRFRSILFQISVQIHKCIGFLIKTATDAVAPHTAPPLFRLQRAAGGTVAYQDTTTENENKPETRRSGRPGM